MLGFGAYNYLKLNQATLGHKAGVDVVKAHGDSDAPAKRDGAWLRVGAAVGDKLALAMGSNGVSANLVLYVVSGVFQVRSDPHAHGPWAALAACTPVACGLLHPPCSHACVRLPNAVQTPTGALHSPSS